MNKAIIVGRLGRDVDVRYSQAGTAIAETSVATTDFWGGEEKTTWHNIIAFGKSAENMEQICQKGDLIAIDGRIDNQTWEREDGTKGYRSQIIVNQWRKLASSQGGQNNQNGRDTPKRNQNNDDDDDIPF